MLKCPKCAGVTDTIDSRDNGEKVRRRHRCRACSFRFTTYEIIEDHEIEKQKDLKRVEAYRQRYKDDKRPDQDILDNLSYIEERTPDELVHLAVYVMGLVK